MDSSYVKKSTGGNSGQCSVASSRSWIRTAPFLPLPPWPGRIGRFEVGFLSKDLAIYTFGVANPQVHLSDGMSS